MAQKDDITTLSEILNTYLVQRPDYVDKLIAVETKFFDSIKKITNSEPRFDVVLKTSRGSGFTGFDSDDSSLSLPDNQTLASTIEAKDVLREFNSTKQITLKAAEETKNRKLYLVDVAKELFDDITYSLMRGIVRLVYAPYTDGHIAEMTLGSTVTVKHDEAVTLTLDHDSSTDTYGAWLIEPGDILDIYTDSGSYKCTVAVLNVENNWYKISVQAYGSSDVDLAADVYYFYLQNTKGKVINPYVLVAAESGTLHNIDRSSYPIFNGTTYDNNGNSGLTITVVRNAVREAKKTPWRRGKKDYTIGYTTYKQLLQLESSIKGEINLIYQSGKDDTLGYGKYYVEVDGIRFVEDENVVPGMCFLPEHKYLEFRTNGRPEWVRPYGGNLILAPESPKQYHKLRATMRHFAQLKCVYPPAQILITHLSNDEF